MGNDINTVKISVDGENIIVLVELQADILNQVETTKLLLGYRNKRDQIVLVGKFIDLNKVQFSQPLKEFNLIDLDEVFLQINTGFRDLTNYFSKLQLNNDKLDDNQYLTNALFNAQIRNLFEDELLITVYSYLNVIDKSNVNYGGLITLMCYRVAEDIDKRKWLVDSIIEAYKDYNVKVNLSDGYAFRWFISSSSTLITILLSYYRVTEAEKIFKIATSKVLHHSLNPLSHVNYSLLLFQGGLIRSWREKFDEACSCFVASLNSARYGMLDILHPKNEWLTGQISDCYMFLHIIKANYTLLQFVDIDSIIPPARFAKISNSSLDNLELNTLFGRFEYFQKNNIPKFFIETVQKLQDKV